MLNMRNTFKFPARIATTTPTFTILSTRTSLTALTALTAGVLMASLLMAPPVPAEEGWVTIQPGESSACAFAKQATKKADSQRIPPQVRASIFNEVTIQCASPENIVPVMPASWRASMLTQINETRGLKKRGTLRQCAALNTAAQKYAETMARTGHYDHIGPNGSDPGDRIEKTGYQPGWWGENIAAGQDTVTEVMVDWIISTGHYHNLMNRNFRYAGFGFATDPSGEAYWVQNFGRNICPTRR